jgi:hypothetical protein
MIDPQSFGAANAALDFCAQFWHGVSPFKDFPPLFQTRQLCPLAGLLVLLAGRPGVYGRLLVAHADAASLALKTEESNSWNLVNLILPLLGSETVSAAPSSTMHEISGWLLPGR